MAIDAWTIILTAVCTGIGVSIGNGLFEAFFKDYFKKLKEHNVLIRKRLLVYKNPWIAALLNVFLWGIGYFYVKKKRILGALLFLLQIFIVSGFSFNQLSWKNIFEGISYSFITLLLSIYIGIDAYNTARKVNGEK